ncbi:peptidyl-alpha-hydroxyglycine alpha-amidating lyase 2-like [Ischnura elegans]|uniref:peptidyl-alpha-hydroxyglycine alpha-amidating lyase 2-like n=1 Tax=Ischnura elegans TaxID=197161 RepID=UPI001ED8A298|nr:peptidyl-alpha-hydroxyglycine alpha-amidating lyase 2-like [Ischnura elegans]
MARPLAGVVVLLVSVVVCVVNARVTAEFYSRMRELLRQRSTANKGSVPIPIEVRGWPHVALPLNVGQVAGISVDLKNRPVIFHRGPVVWDQGSFNGHNEYLHVDDGPIQEDTVLTLDPDSGAVVHAWGAGHFFMPHGLTVDPEGQVWLTDVAMHQVFRYPPEGANVATLTLGRRFEPGRDSAHFCQPTSVAVAPGTSAQHAGDIFVGDGYCNARVVHLTPSGRFVREIKARDEGIWPGFNVVHSVALLSGPELLCVADRDNRRVACATIEMTRGASWHRHHVEWKLPHFRSRTSAAGSATGAEDPLHPVIEVMAPGGGRVFALCSAPDNDTLYAVTGPSEPTALEPHPIAPTGIVIRPSATYIDTYWGPSSQDSFSAPHAIAISPDGDSLYVSEIGPDRVWKFSLNRRNVTEEPHQDQGRQRHQHEGQQEQEMMTQQHHQSS